MSAFKPIQSSEFEASAASSSASSLDDLQNARNAFQQANKLKQESKTVEAAKKYNEAAEHVIRSCGVTLDDLISSKAKRDAVAQVLNTNAEMFYLFHAGQAWITYTLDNHHGRGAKPKFCTLCYRPDRQRDDPDSKRQWSHIVQRSIHRKLRGSAASAGRRIGETAVAWWLLCGYCEHIWSETFFAPALLEGPASLSWSGVFSVKNEGDEISGALFHIASSMAWRQMAVTGFESQFVGSTTLEDFRKLWFQLRSIALCSADRIASETPPFLIIAGFVPCHNFGFGHLLFNGSLIFFEKGFAVSLFLGALHFYIFDQALSSRKDGLVELFPSTKSILIPPPSLRKLGSWKIDYVSQLEATQGALPIRAATVIDAGDESCSVVDWLNRASVTNFNGQFRFEFPSAGIVFGRLIPPTCERKAKPPELFYFHQVFNRSLLRTSCRHYVYRFPGNVDVVVLEMGAAMLWVSPDTTLDACLVLQRRAKDGKFVEHLKIPNFPHLLDFDEAEFQTTYEEHLDAIYKSALAFKGTVSSPSNSPVFHEEPLHPQASRLVEECHKSGNDYFKASDYEAAIVSYTTAIQALLKYFKPPLSIEMCELLCKLYCNKTLALIKCGDPQHGLVEIQKALDMAELAGYDDFMKGKALGRKAECLYASKDYEAAVNVCDQVFLAEQVGPGVKRDVLKLKSDLLKSLKEE
jgi:hypothetical protein